MKKYKLLLITRSDPHFNARLHTLFYRKLNRYFDTSIIEGPKHDIQISPEEVIERYNPDVTLCHAHAKKLMGFFKPFKCLKVMMAVDFHKILRRQNYDFYNTNNFDIVFQRGCIDYKTYNTINKPFPDEQMVWLPFSADRNIFNPRWDVWDNRKKKIAFVGTYSGEVYEIRRRAISHLYGNIYNAEDQVITKPSMVIKTNEYYPHFLQKYISYLNGADPMVFYSPYAKIFEIIASGALLFTSPFGSSNILFPKDCFVEYKEDCSNIIEKAKYIMNNASEMKIKAMMAYSYYEEQHTDDKRLQELTDNIINQLEGRPLIRKWGQ